MAIYPNKAHNKKSLTRTVLPSSEPVSLADVKLFLRIDSTDFDSLLDRHITSAREWLENYLHRSFISQTHVLSCDYLENGMELPNPPITSITSVTIHKNDGTDSTWSTDNYFLFNNKLMFSQNADTSVSTRSNFGFSITYVAGYSGNVASCIKDAIMRLVASLHENNCFSPEILDEVKMLVSSEKIYQIGAV